MRLTLRTMLAYMDDILEPDDADDIRQKIEASEFASGLLRRTRECVGRLRLGAPPLGGKGMALDANTVAEYLDNTLSSARVPDFEKVCLESDVHLAEVAASHQILTLVLGEPAEIDTAARERMYQLAYRRDAAHGGQQVASAIAAAEEVTAVPAAAASAARPRPEVPDYLRASRSRPLALLAGVVVAAAIGLVVFGMLALFGPEKIQKRLLAMLGKSPYQREVDSDEPPAERNTNESTNGTNSGRNGASSSNGAGANRDGTNIPPIPSPTAGESVVDTGPDEAVDVPPIVPTNNDQEDTAGDAGEAMADAAIEADASATTDVGPGAELDIPPRDDSPLETPVGPAISGDEQEAPAPRTIVDDAATGGLGRFFSEQDVLLRWDRTSESWRRLATKAAVGGGDRLLSLPGFRPRLTLSSGIDLQAAGAAQFTLQPADADGTPGVALEDGRLLLATAGRPMARLRVSVGDRTGIVTFGDAEASAAIEVRAITLPGEDPRKTSSLAAIELFVSSGAIEWEEAPETIRLMGPAARSLTPDLATDTPLDRFPKWIAADALSGTELRAAKVMREKLMEDRPIGLIVKELAEHRQSEVRSLAVRSAAYVGQYDLLVAGLSDLDQRSDNPRYGWPAYVELLRSAVARSPQAAEEVAAAFTKLRGADGENLFRMLWGYTPAQLRDGEANHLVDYLNHDSLDYRELSLWNLQSLTGVNLTYRPHESAKQRAPMIRKWRERIKDGKAFPLEKASAEKT